MGSWPPAAARQLRPGRWPTASPSSPAPGPCARPASPPVRPGHEGHRDVQHQGRRRQDLGRGQPGLPGAAGGYRTLLWDLDPQAAATYMFRVKPRVKGGGKALVRGARPLDDAIKGTDFEHLDLLPADFTYRNIDLALNRPSGPPGGCPDCSARWPASTTSCSSTARQHLAGVGERPARRALLLVPLIPTTLSVRTFDQLTSFIDDLSGRPARRAGVLLPGRPAQAAAPRHHHPAARRALDIATAIIPAMTLVEQMSVRRAPVPLSRRAARPPGITRSCGPSCAPGPASGERTSRTARAAGDRAARRRRAARRPGGGRAGRRAAAQVPARDRPEPGLRRRRRGHQGRRRRPSDQLVLAAGHHGAHARAARRRAGPPGPRYRRGDRVQRRAAGPPGGRAGRGHDAGPR